MIGSTRPDVHNTLASDDTELASPSPFKKVFEKGHTNSLHVLQENNPKNPLVRASLSRRQQDQYQSMATIQPLQTDRVGPPPQTVLKHPINSARGLHEHSATLETNRTSRGTNNTKVLWANVIENSSRNANKTTRPLSSRIESLRITTIK